MITVEIWSDVVCPFCFIGKKHFESALQQFEHKDSVQVTWRSFELDPNSAPSQKIKIEEVLAQKYGRSIEWARQNNQNLAERAKTVGIDFQFEKIIPSNSFNAHRLMHLASAHQQENKLAELLFEAYFTKGFDIADLQVLEDLGRKAELPAEKVRNLLQSNQYTKEVRSEEDEARQLSITGVPAFVINRKYLVSGAQPSETFLEALRAAQNEQ